MMRGCKGQTLYVFITLFFGVIWLITTVTLMVLAILSVEDSFAKTTAIIYLPLVLVCALMLVPFAWSLYKYEESPEADDVHEMYRAAMVCFGLLSAIMAFLVFIWPFIVVIAYLIRVISTDSSEETLLLIISTLDLICWGVFMYGMTMLYEAEERRRLRIEPIEHASLRERQELYATVTNETSSSDVSRMFCVGDSTETPANNVNENGDVQAPVTNTAIPNHVSNAMATPDPMTVPAHVTVVDQSVRK